MQYSPPIPFEGASQCNTKHPDAMKPGQEFVRLTMFTGEHDPVPSWPWPTYATWGTVLNGVGDHGAGYYNTIHGASPTAIAGYNTIYNLKWAPNVGSYTYLGGSDEPLYCKDWFQLGAYIVGVAPSSSIPITYPPVGYPTAPIFSGQIYGNDVIVWSAPGPMATITSTTYPGGLHALTTAGYDNGHCAFASWTPGNYDVSWVVATYLYPEGLGGVPVPLYNTYYTGSGSESLAGVTTLRYAIVVGMIAVLFDDDGIGCLSYTGDWTIPFDYQRRCAGYVTTGWPINVNGWVYFVDRGGKLFRTDGSYVLEVGGGYFPGMQESAAYFNAGLIPEIANLGFTWPDTLANAENWMQFDQLNHRLVYNFRYVDGTVRSAGLAMIEINSGKFQFLPDAANIGADAALPRVETGGIKLTDPANRTQVFYADIDFEIQGDPTAYSAVPDGPIAFGSTGNDIQGFGIYSGFEVVVPQQDIDLGSSTITSAAHGFTDGQQVVYSAHGGSPITGLTDHSTYYVIYLSDSQFQLSATAAVTSGTSIALAATNAFDGTMSDGPNTYVLTSGRQTVRCPLNLTVDRIPRFRLTLNSPPANTKCRFWGIQRVAFDVNGELP